jgi:hypothetical protein
MRSALYVGRVVHRRTVEPAHTFHYPVWYVLLDPDELDELAAGVVGFSYNRFNLVSFDDRDHLGPERRPVRYKLEQWLAGAGVAAAPARIELLTLLRVFGHVFNPVSFHYCYGYDDRLLYVVAEVNNTFGETYCYLLHAEEADTVRDQAEKVFHVSPFQPMAGSYSFRLTAPGESLAVHIGLERDGGRVFDAGLTLERRPLTGGKMLRTVLRYPHAGFRTLGLIHWQALRLWLRRAPFFSKPEPPAGAWRSRNG